MHEEHERVVRQLREEHTKQLAGVQEEKEALKRAALRRTIHLRYQKEKEARSYALALEAGERPSPVCKLPAVSDAFCNYVLSQRAASPANRPIWRSRGASWPFVRTRLRRRPARRVGRTL